MREPEEEVVEVLVMTHTPPYSLEQLKAWRDGPRFDHVTVSTWEKVLNAYIELLEAQTPLVERTLATRDQSKDVPCKYCGAPLWEMYPDAPHALKWGHTTREDSSACLDTRHPGRWPIPADT